MKYLVRGLCTLLLFFNLSSCAFKRICRFKDLTYLKADSTAGTSLQKLNIFTPRKPKNLKDVFIFIHGGNWNSGKKSLYNYFGSRMARKDVVAVIIDYPLSPKAQYAEMAMASAHATKWVKQNIEKYGGNPDKIFLSGHSAGGHLAALISVRNNFFDTLGIENPIKGTILIDAAGLDMYGFLKEERSPAQTYMRTFTANPNEWKNASPLYHLHKGMPPMLIYRGGKTYPSIIQGNEKFVKALKNYNAKPDFHILKGKKHIPMITQFFWIYNPHYREIINFMKVSK